MFDNTLIAFLFISAIVKTPSSEPVLRSRLLPRISFQTMLAVTTACAILAALANNAGNGGQLAYALVMAIGFLLACVFLSSFVFILAWAAAMNRFITAIGFWLISAGLIAAVVTGLHLPGIGNWPLIMFTFFAGLALITIRSVSSENRARSPFAADQLPPQMIAPREPMK